MFTLTELGFVLKVLLNHAPFFPSFPGLMQDLSGELFSHATQKVHLGDHRETTGDSCSILCAFHDRDLKIRVVTQSWDWLH